MTEVLKRKGFFENAVIFRPTNKVTVKPYTGDCKHENLSGYSYGFRHGWGCKGIGTYIECLDCGAKEYEPDMESILPEEEEWYKNSPFSQGWVTVTYNKED